MNPLSLSLMLITGLIIILFSPVTAYSELTSGTKYLIQGSGFVADSNSIADSTLAIQVTAGSQSGGNVLATIDNGLVTIGGLNYLNTGNWTTTFLRGGNFLLLQGDVKDQGGNLLHINLFGRIIENNQEGSVYSITGKITGAQTTKVIYSAKVAMAGTSVSTTTTPSAPTSVPQKNQTQANVVKISMVPGASNPFNQIYFSPSIVHVSTGTTIIWTNNDTVSHRIMSGTASAFKSNGAAPVFTSDGKIDSGEIPPGKSFQYTVTSFDTSTNLSPAAAKYLNLTQEQSSGDITFYDPNYNWMVGVIGPISTSQTEAKAVQINILSGASTATNNLSVSPSSVQVTPGSTVEWINNDSVPHRILSGISQDIRQGGAGAVAPGSQARSPYFKSDGRIDSGVIAPGQSFKYTVKGLGVITYYDPSNTWLNGNIIAVPQISENPPVEIDIQPGSSLPQGSSSQSNQNNYNVYYSPTTVQISPGTTIIWKNNDNIAHRIWSGVSTQSTAKPFIPDGKIKSESILPGESFEFTINDSGITRFYDPSYQWMNGLIVSIPSTTSHVISAPSHNPSLH